MKKSVVVQESVCSQYSWLWAFSTDNCVNKGWDGYLVDFSGLLMHNISKREKKIVVVLINVTF